MHMFFKVWWLWSTMWVGIGKYLYSSPRNQLVEYVQFPEAVVYAVVLRRIGPFRFYFLQISYGFLKFIRCHKGEFFRTVFDARARMPKVSDALVCKDLGDYTFKLFGNGVVGIIPFNYKGPTILARDVKEGAGLVPTVEQFFRTMWKVHSY